MFELPSMSNLIISTLVFFVAAWYLRRLLNEQGIPHSMTRGLLVFVLASLVSWGSGELVDKIQGKEVKPAAQTDMSQLIKALGQPQP